MLALVHLLYRNLSLFFLSLCSPDTSVDGTGSVVPNLSLTGSHFVAPVAAVRDEREPVNDVSGGSRSSFSFNGAARAFSETPLTITPH